MVVPASNAGTNGSGMDMNSYPVTPLEPALSRQKLLQVAKNELNKNLDGVEDSDNVVGKRKSRRRSRVENMHGEAEENGEDNSDTDEDTDTSSSYDEDEDVSIQLVNMNISSIPLELIDLYKDHVSKLSLKGNWLQGLPQSFDQMAHLVYLDISNNRLEQFPQILCQCPNLEILDISSNNISEMPHRIGNLEQLKCLSMFNNKFEYLPPCIADMADLQILELEQNPLVLPSKSYIEPKPTNPEQQLEWISKIRQFLDKNRDQIYAKLQELRNTHTSNTGGSFKLQAPPPSKSHKHQQSLTPPSSHQRGPMPPPLKRSLSEAPQNETNQATSERLRSNSEGQSSTRAAKRMGFVVKKQHQSLPEDDESHDSSDTSREPTPKHTPKHSPPQQHQQHFRGPSHDSAIDNGSKDPDETPKPKSSHQTGGSQLGSISGSGETSPNFHKIPSSKDIESTDLQYKVVETSRKILFALNEFHAVLRRCAGFCEDKQLVAKIMNLLQASQQPFPQLAESLETLESTDDCSKDQINQVINASVKCLAAFRNLTAFVKANLDVFAAFIDVKYLRTLILTVFQAFSELHNAWYMVYPVRTVNRQMSRQLAMGKGLKKDTSGTALSSQMEDVLRSGEGLNAADDHLYDKIYQAATAAQTVLGKLTEAVSRSAAAASHDNNVNSTIASKVKDLMHTSVTGVEVTKKLMARLHGVRESNDTMDRRKFWEELSAFLKAVIGILASTKSAMADIPTLDEVRPNLGKLTKLAKEVPILLEYSSYKSMLNDPSQVNQPLMPGQQSPIISMTQNLPPPPTTPLVAVLGQNAAQAVTSPSTTPQGYSPFIPESQQASGNSSPSAGSS